MADDSEINIKVKKLQGVTVDLKVNRDLPVLALKEQLVESSGLPVEGQKVIFMGKVLQDQQTLRSYGKS